MNELKKLVSTMNKEDRMAFLLLERKIIEQKIEILRSIPPQTLYNDSEIKSEINEVSGKINSLYTNIEQIKDMKEKTAEYEKEIGAYLDTVKKLEDFNKLLSVTLSELWALIAFNSTFSNAVTKSGVEALNRLNEMGGMNVIFKPKGHGASKFRRLNQAFTVRDHRKEEKS